MNNIAESLDNLKQYVECTNEEFSVYKYLRYYESELVSDIDNFKYYLFSDQLSETRKYELIYALHKAKEWHEKYRSHSKSNDDELYNKFLELYKDSSITYSEFNRLLKCINGIELIQPLNNYIDKAKRLIKCLQSYDLNRIEILQYLSYVSTNNVTVDKMISYLDKDINKDDAKEMKLCLSTLKSKVCADAASLVIDDENYNNDSLENSKIYYSFSSCVLKRNDCTISIVVCPNPLFISKFVNDPLLKDKEVIFVFEENEITTIYHSLYKQKNVSFVTFKHIRDVLLVNPKLIGTFLSLGSMYHNDAETVSLLHNIESYLASDADILLFANDSKLNHDVLISKEFIASNKLYIDSCVLFPDGINKATKPEKKILMKLSNKINTEHNIIVSSYTLADGKHQYLKLRSFQANMKLSLYLSGIKIRSFYSGEYYNHLLITGKTREAKLIYQYSKEINVFYTASNPNNNIFPTINIYLCRPYKDIDEDGIIIDGKGSKMKSSNKQLTNTPLSKLDDYIENDYFNCIKRSNNGQTIRQVIFDDFYLAYENEEITFKTLTLLYEEFENALNTEERKILFNIVNSEIGWLLPHNLTADIINDFINNYFNDNNPYLIRNAYSIISNLFDFAIQTGHAFYNPIKSEAKLINKDRQGIIDVRKAVSKASINLTQIKKLVNNVLSLYNTGVDIGLAILLKIFTPLTYKEICGLKIIDLFDISDFEYRNKKITYLKIRRMVNDEGKYLPLTRLNSYRNVVLPSYIASMLIEKRDKILNKYSSLPKDIVQNTPLFAGDYVMPNTGFKLLLPSMLSEKCRKELKKLGLSDNYVEIFSGNKKEIINLAFSKADLLRNNYRYYAINKGMFTEDELEFICGNKPTTTFSNNYCDFNNEIILFSMYLKQERIASYFLYKDEEFAYKNDFQEEHVQYSSHDRINRTFILINGEPISNDVKIDIESSYAFNASYSLIKEEQK